MKRDTPHILLINPWIHDFAAYDFWAKPMGLLTLAALLRTHELSVSYIDCLDRFHPGAPDSNPFARFGRGSYLKTRIAKPAGLDDVPRFFSRYGIKPNWFRDDLLALPRPDLVFVTSLMTYWYPGVQEAVEILKSVYPNTPIILGGIYASLCPEHAKKHSGAQTVVTGPAEKKILKLVESHTGFSSNPTFNPANLDTYPYPALDLQTKITYVPILTSRGCPFRCTYCASHLLDPRQMRRSPLSVVEEIKYWHEKYDIIDFVLYDDAFLVDAANHAIPILEKIIRAELNLRFHTPNAVHIRGISRYTASLLYKAGFKTLRLGLESTEFEHREQLDQKVSADEFERAAACLRQAGFNRQQVGAYLLVGLPGQQSSALLESIHAVKQSGITPVLAYYSPIPRTALWKQAVAASRYDLESDPIFTNNAIFPCQKETFSWKTISHLKNVATI